MAQYPTSSATIFFWKCIAVLATEFGSRPILGLGYISCMRGKQNASGYPDVLEK
ncbi:hypothetical protein [Shimia sp. MMG029]|uniref:hypothetical protein n=1 Tax=Shimia sp. MMG029 TaxID=3021978 RepID=UPI0022FDBCA8|nr:hypothetical protein [Shimia sp. MMG029]MDA5557726.1 hypothetical protein [Shimia sp. MMG029]